MPWEKNARSAVEIQEQRLQGWRGGGEEGFIVSDIDIRPQRVPSERENRERLKCIIVHVGELFEL